jgi:Mn-dependent DtxR family transcriptional regulator
MRASQIARETLSLEDRILLVIHDDPSTTKAARAMALGIPPSRYQRILERLAQQRLIRKFRNKWELTKDGQRAVDEITEGQKQPEELE